MVRDKADGNDHMVTDGESANIGTLPPLLPC